MPFTTPASRRAIAALGFFSLGGSYLLMKTRAIQAQNKEKVAGDYSVSPARSGGGI